MVWKFTDKKAEKEVYGTLEDCLREYADLYHLDYEQESMAGCLLDMVKYEAQEKDFLEDVRMIIENTNPDD